MIYHRAINNYSLTLTSAVDNIVTVFTVNESPIALPAVLPVYISIGAELVEVTDVSVNDLTVVRGVSGTTATPHDAGTLLRLTIVAETINEIIEGLANLSSTGLLKGGSITQNADPAKYDVSAGKGRVVNNYTDSENPEYVSVSWDAFTAVVLPNIATQTVSYISIDAAAAISPFDWDNKETEFRDKIFLGSIAHPNGVSISGIADEGRNAAFDVALALVDQGEAIGPINAGGNVYFANAGANLSIDKSAGSVASISGNIKANPKNPNRIPVPSGSAIDFFYTFQNGAGGWSVSAQTEFIVPGKYDDGTGVLGTVANNQWSIHRIFTTISLTVVHYGQAVYASKAAAIDGIHTEVFSINPDLSGGLLRSFLIVKGNTTSLLDLSDTLFVEASKFGGAGTGGGTSSTTNLQQAYDNSPLAEIILNSVNGPLCLQDNVVPLTGNLFFIGPNGGGSDFFAVTRFGASVTGTLPITGQAHSTSNALVDAATIATDCDLGNTHTVTLGGNRTLGAPTNLKSGATYLWTITQDGTGTRTLAYNAVFKFPGGTAPVLSTASGSVDILSGWSDGTNVYANLAADFS